ncbi:MAG: hypothetical protein O3B87_04350 [bacterium]|nr:hypothetical protein [bacterium]
MHDYTNEQIIAQVDENDTIIKSIERWEAHKKGILHRALTITVQLEQNVLLQHRKHPVFDGVWDMTVSTHQLYDGDVLQDDMTAIMLTLERELAITSEDLVQQPIKKGVVQYKAKDPKSDYIEHEVCHIYSCSVRALPKINNEYAYELTTVNRQELEQSNNHLGLELAPWVIEMLQHNY